ncbi:MAG: hypothetical protein QW212_02055 [Nitrososphaerales archaeon]
MADVWRKYGKIAIHIQHVYGKNMATVWQGLFLLCPTKVLEIASKLSQIAEVSEGKIKAILGPNGEPIQSYNKQSPKELIWE